MVAGAAVGVLICVVWLSEFLPQPTKIRLGRMMQASAFLNFSLPSHACALFLADLTDFLSDN
jgi:hypothetical protein